MSMIKTFYPVVLSILMSVITMEVAYCDSVKPNVKPNVKPTPDKKGVEELAKKIDDLDKQEAIIEKKVINQAKELEILIKNYNKSEQRLKGLNGLGRIEQMELKAELYGIEKQARKQFEEQVTEMLKLMKEWEECKREIAISQKLLKLKQENLNLQNTIEEEEAPATAATNYNREQIEFFTLPKTMTLQDISVLKYGDQSLWKYIAEANRKTVKNVTVPVPKGTTLVIPDKDVILKNNDSELNFDNL